MKALIVFLFLCLSASGSAQYYFDDIKDAGQLSETMKTYVDNKVTGISATGYDPQGAKTTDFNEWQEIDAQHFTLTISGRNGQQVRKQHYQFDNQLRVLNYTDSSGDIKSATVYTYNDDGRIRAVKTITDDQFSDFNKTEEHQWLYDKNGNPEKMWRIINGTDSTEFGFVPDEKGNIAEEKLYRRGVAIESVYYYYYDDENRITDIVHYDKKLKALMPDFIYVYDEQDRVIQKTNVLSTVNRDYLIWRYLYNEKGLKIKEALFNKEKELRGRIEYAYTFAG